MWVVPSVMISLSQESELEDIAGGKEMREGDPSIFLSDFLGNW